MRPIAPELAARLASGVTTLAHVWRIVRRDGAEFGFTDHDRALVFEGVACAPATALAGGSLEKGLGLAVDNASVAGVLNSAAIDEDELARGLWDGARVDLYRVDWTDPTLFAHLFAGRLGEIRRGAHGFEIELRGLTAPLNVPVGRVFSRFCDADVGDARCGVDLDAPAFKGAGAVTEVLSTRAFRASGLGAFADGWFARGVLTWNTGGAVEVSAHRAAPGDALIELIEAPAAALTVGAGFTITAGCDKRHIVCRDKFANVVNFRGHPHMPGNDAVQAGPAARGNDGGSRWAP